MDTADFEYLIKTMNQIIELKNKIEEEEECKECIRCCPIEMELKNEYESIMKWGFGVKQIKCSVEQAREMWQIRHPDLELPRILTSKATHPIGLTIGLFLDLIPMYHECKKKKYKSCDNVN